MLINETAVLGLNLYMMRNASLSQKRQYSFSFSAPIVWFWKEKVRKRKKKVMGKLWWDMSYSTKKGQRKETKREGNQIKNW